MSSSIVCTGEFGKKQQSPCTESKTTVCAGVPSVLMDKNNRGDGPDYHDFCIWEWKYGLNTFFCLLNCYIQTYLSSFFLSSLLSSFFLFFLSSFLSFNSHVMYIWIWVHACQVLKENQGLYPKIANGRENYVLTALSGLGFFLS